MIHATAPCVRVIRSALQAKAAITGQIEAFQYAYVDAERTAMRLRRIMADRAKERETTR